LPDNPDLLDADGLIDASVLRARRGILWGNPKICVCSTLEPISKALCLAVTIGQFVSFNQSNVCLSL
jgi:hypothetical protein